MKSNQGYDLAWRLTPTAERWEEPPWFYVFVNLNDTGAPSFYVVPSAVVAAHTRDRHKGRVTRGGKDDGIRDFRPTKAEAAEYRDAWGRLGLD